MKATQKALAEVMKRLSYTTKIHDKTDQIHTSYIYEENEYHIFIGSLNDGNFVQLITFIPCVVVDTSINDVCRFLHIVNKELDTPGFCYDEETKTVLYRIVIPCIRKEIHEELFEAYLHASKNTCETFGTVVQALAIGAMSLNEVFEKMVENEGRKKEAPKVTTAK
ncbi:MAG: YbjN domain-containing protein [Chlamydia sp.]